MSRISTIVKGLNQFSRDNQSLDEDCNVHAIIDNCLVLLWNNYKNKVEIDKQYYFTPLIVKGNVGKLHQVFTNIIINSVQSIKSAGKITIKTCLIGNTATIEIIDNGCGISKENLTKIFDPFFTTKNPGEGTGLGLSITYSIIKEHKGSIEFESVLNKGTKAIISLISKY